MKRLVLSLALLLIGQATFAQEGAILTKNPKLQDHGQRGMYVGLDYMNITDFKSKSSFYDRVNGYVTEEHHGGTRVGMLGVTVGYARTPEQGIGFSTGLRLLERMNTSKEGETEMRMYIPEFNLTAALNRYFTTYLGLNTFLWDNENIRGNYKAQLGGQLGVGVRFTKYLALNAGWTIVRVHLVADSDSSEIQLGGFNSNLTYTF